MEGGGPKKEKVNSYLSFFFFSFFWPPPLPLSQSLQAVALAFTAPFHLPFRGRTEPLDSRSLIVYVLQ